MQSDLLSLVEAASYLRLHPDTLRRRVAKSKRLLANDLPPEIRFQQHGEGRIWFRLAWLDAYIDAIPEQERSRVLLSPKTKRADGVTLPSNRDAGLPDWF
jgi:hypothetical protein